MLYRQFGSTGWKLSPIGVGCRNVGKRGGVISEGMIAEIVKIAYVSGINLFDATEAKGDEEGVSEIRLGKALKGIRNKVYIAAKLKPVPGPMDHRYLTPEELVRASFHLAAARLNTEYIDILLCENSGGEINEEYIYGLNLLKKEGLIRAYGISTTKIEELSKFYEMSQGNCEVAQLEYSLLNTKPEHDLLPFCKNKRMAVLVKSPLAQGLLAGKFDRKTVFKDPVRREWNVDGKDRESFEKNLEKVDRLRAQLEDASDMTTTALRYVLSHQAEPFAVPGATSPEQVLKNVRAGLRIFSSEEIQALKAIL